MTFDVYPQELRNFGRHLVDCADDATEGRTYIARHGDMSVVTQGLFNVVLPAHRQVVEEIKRSWKQLDTLLDESRVALNNAAGCYEWTDQEAAARVDATFPSVPRPRPR